MQGPLHCLISHICFSVQGCTPSVIDSMALPIALLQLCFASCTVANWCSSSVWFTTCLYNVVCLTGLFLVTNKIRYPMLQLISFNKYCTGVYSVLLNTVCIFHGNILKSILILYYYVDTQRYLWENFSNSMHANLSYWCCATNKQIKNTIKKKR